jgi:glycosyltransferase involved in cell wall biosynthesis
MVKKTVFLMNYPSHYRLAIYRNITDALDADFYFGDIANSNIERIKPYELTNYISDLKTFRFGKFLWYFGSLGLLFRPYTNYILTGDPHILSNWVLLLLGRLFRKKVFLWTHGLYGREGKLNKALKKNYFRLADHIFVYNDYSRNLLLSENFASNRVTSIFNSLDYEKQINIRHQLETLPIYEERFSNEYPTLLFIGRLQKRKKLDLVLRSMSLLNELGSPVNFVVIGKEEADYSFGDEVVKYKLSSQVWIYGPSFDERTNAEMIFNADLFVCPGSVGLAAIHCLSYGLPVITHNNFAYQTPEFEVIVDGFNGSFFEEDCVEDLSKKILSVLDMRISRSDCYKVIDDRWNPNHQVEIFKKVLDNGFI